MINLEWEVQDYLERQGYGEYYIILKSEYALNAEMNSVLHTPGFNNHKRTRKLFADFRGEFKEDSFVMFLRRRRIEVPYISVNSCVKLSGPPQ